MGAISLADANPGDIVFCHSAGIVGRAIRLAEFFRRDWYESKLGITATERPGDFWNHVAVLSSVHGMPYDPAHWTVIQAEGKGVVSATLDTVAPGGRYEIVRLPNGVDATKVIRFMGAQTGSHYGFITIASILVTLLSPRFYNVMLPGTWICSAVAAEAMRYGGWLHNWGDVYQVSPAQTWMALR